MENTVAKRPARKTDNNANKTGYYATIALAVFIGLVGVFIRFAPDVWPSLDQMTFTFSLVANLLMIIAALIVFRTVFGILGFGKNRD